jgi:hypothetical protein
MTGIGLSQYTNYPIIAHRELVGDTGPTFQAPRTHVISLHLDTPRHLGLDLLLLIELTLNVTWSYSAIRNYYHTVNHYHTPYAVLS